jgi:glucosamine-6-phosphate deaminase
MNYGKTRIELCEDNQALGRTAATQVADRLRARLAQQPRVTMVFASAESQFTFLDHLVLEPGLDWQRVHCFGMDEVWGTGVEPAGTCIALLRQRLYDRVRPGHYEFPRADAPNAALEVQRYAAAFAAAGGIDILCQGIGRTGHLAFNEPGQASFTTRDLVHLITVDELSKAQLRDDPHFGKSKVQASHAITLTVPALMAAREVFTMVPLRTKRPIITRLLATPVPDPLLPASILSAYAGTLFLDRDSCPVSHGGRA